MLQVETIRAGRPTDSITSGVKGGLGPQLPADFAEDQGFSGIEYGSPSALLHLDFTHETKLSPGAAPSHDKNPVLTMQSATAVADMTAKSDKMAQTRMKSANPYWHNYGVIDIPDTGGWHVVLTPAIPGFMKRSR